MVLLAGSSFLRPSLCCSVLVDMVAGPPARHSSRIFCQVMVRLSACLAGLVVMACWVVPGNLVKGCSAAHNGRLTFALLCVCVCVFFLVYNTGAPRCSLCFFPEERRRTLCRFYLMGRQKCPLGCDVLELPPGLCPARERYRRGCRRVELISYSVGPLVSLSILLLCRSTRGVCIAVLLHAGRMGRSLLCVRNVFRKKTHGKSAV